MPTASANLLIRNRLGLHARPAMSVVDAASRFASQIHLIKAGQKVDAKSIMHLMLLAAGQGETLQVVADGHDAEAAVKSIQTLFEQGFGEE